MRLKHALWLLAAATAGVGGVGVRVSMAAENVATCEVAVNQKTLEILLLRQNETRTAIDLVDQKNAKRFYEITGRGWSELDPLLEKLAKKSMQSNSRALGLSDELIGLLQETCDKDRGVWVAWSLFLTLLTAALSCLALWVGLRVDQSLPPAGETTKERRPQDPREAPRNPTSRPFDLSRLEAATKVIIHYPDGTSQRVGSNAGASDG